MFSDLLSWFRLAVLRSAASPGKRQHQHPLTRPDPSEPNGEINHTGTYPRSALASRSLGSLGDSTPTPNR